MFKQAAGEDYIIFNGPDEQFMSGRVIGAEGAIGGTYGAMPELFLKPVSYTHLDVYKRQVYISPVNSGCGFQESGPGDEENRRKWCQISAF